MGTTTDDVEDIVAIGVVVPSMKNRLIGGVNPVRYLVLSVIVSVPSQL